MKILESDLKKLMDVQAILKEAKMSVSPTDCVGVADTIIWFRDFCQRVGKAWQEEKAPKIVDSGGPPEPPKPIDIKKGKK